MSCLAFVWLKIIRVIFIQDHGTAETEKNNCQASRLDP